MNKKSLEAFVSLLLVGLFSVSCSRPFIQNADQAMRPAASWPSLDDDLDLPSLLRGLEENVRKLKEKPSQSLMKFGPREIPVERYVAALEGLLAAGREDKTGLRFREVLRKDFEPYEIYGRDGWGEVFITSYYEPLIEGALRPTRRFQQAIYGVPKDLIEIDVESFVKARPQLQALRSVMLEQRSQASTLRGRVVRKANGSTPRAFAYPSRAEILEKGLKGLAPVLAWVDPIDAFFLEIQGSGVIRLGDGSELAVGYAAQNGHPYTAVGRFLLDRIPKEKMSIQAIESHLRSVSREEAQALMNENASFVFFRKLTPQDGQTFFGTKLIDGRSIATDQAYFPKGALAYVEFNRPVFQSGSTAEPSGWQPTQRFVLDQDTGGAIRGPDRLDLYWGRGALAKQSAGVMRHPGRLVYFVPKTPPMGH